MKARAAASLMLLVLVFASGPRAWAAGLEASLKDHLAALAGDGRDRGAGSMGARGNADYVAAELARVTGQTVRRQSFLMTLPVVEECTAVDNNGAAVELAPLLPSGCQAAALVPDDAHGATADLVYVRGGTLENLRGKDLTHRFVAIDAASDPLAWQTAAELGARAVIFLGDARTCTSDLLNKATDIPVGIPRFYCDESGAVARIQSGGAAALTIRVRTRWEEKSLDNISCFLPGKLNAGQYIVLQARHDGASQVMGRAPGATQAASAAALLELAGKIAAAPEHTSVLVLFTAGDEWNFRGTRAALDLWSVENRNYLRALRDLQQQIAAVAQRRAAAGRILAGLQSMVQTPSAGAADLSALREDDTRTAVEDQLLRASSRVEDALQQARLAVPRDERLIASLQAQREALLAASGALGAAPRNADQIARIQSAAGESLPRWQTQVARLTELRAALGTWPQIRQDIGDRRAMLFVALALSSGSARYGFFSRSFYSPILDTTGNMTGFAFRRYAPAASSPAGIGAAGFAPESMENRFTLETFFPNRIAFSSDAALTRGLPAGAFATIQDPQPFLDTPNDTVDHLSPENLAVQVRSLEELLLGLAKNGGALTDPLFYARTDLPVYTADQQVTLFERAVGETLPRLTAAHCLLGGQSEFRGSPLGPMLAATRRFDWYLTYADGTAVFQSSFRTDKVLTRLQACDFDADGQPARTLAGNQAEVRGMAADFFPEEDRPVRAMLFDSRRLDCYGLFDPRYLDTLDRIDVYDAQRMDKAQYSNVYAGGGLAAVFTPPDLRWQLLLARGAIANRMLLLNADAQHPSGQGFATTDLAAIGPLPWRNVQDLGALNDRRQRDLEKFGISNEVIKELQAASKIEIDAARAAEAARDYPAFFAAANAAWSLQSQVYENLIDTSNGIIKGVIFLLLGIIPFSYFLERLLIGSANVYRQIAGFGVIFLVMTAALWFHPAFRISSAPLMILLAFLILILSSAVVYILWGKFEEEIARLRGAGTAGAAHSTSLRRGAVLGAAVRLGLSNMRRRGLRTALTLLTLILLTFTLLCFTSVRESVQITPRAVNFPAGLPMPPPGVLLRQRLWTTLPENTLALANELALPGPGPVARRWWYSSAVPEQTWALPAQNPTTGAAFYANALLGLEPAEGAFQATPIDSILPGFAQLSENPHLCWLPEEARKSAALSRGDTVIILGAPFTIAGFFTDAAFQKLRQLTGDPLSPIDPAGAPASGGTSPLPSTAAPETSYRFLGSANIIVLPGSFVRQLGGRLTSIMFRPGASAETSAPGMLQFAEDLSRRCAFSIYVSDGARVRSINAAAASQPKDFSAVLVPMLIAAIIILNTMLGAVAERTREIHVYTSIGLAPAHVGMLFLAEAAALGTIGVVSGYIFGQGLATVLTWTHLLPGVDLNYSSLSAIVTMGLVLGLVMLSALWPARAATRVAAPSLQRDWKLPRPVGDILSVELPFTVNETAARGVCAFVEEFFVSAAQTGAGRFTADSIEAFLKADDPAGIVRGIGARIWLAPYDLGVIEMLRLSIHPTPQHNIFDVRLELTREAGNPGSWRRLNRPFLTEIRKQFLLWRSLSPEQIKHYLERSEKLFDRAPRQ